MSGNGRRKAEVVQAELSHLGILLFNQKILCGTYGDKARIFAILREWVGQVPKVVDFCGRVLRLVHDELFPLDEVPKKLEDLFVRFV